MIGTKLAHYEITSHLGTGGMGEVYRAIDTKLGRSVAIKFLPVAFSSDAERLARFRREAQVLASLNHPNIAHIYGIEESGEKRCIVMELVEGETLQTRIKNGPVPVDEALAIATQIAEALAVAHEKGVVHRDLKPGNVMLTSDGRVKVLDFGLAKAYDANPSDTSPSNSPTVASLAATNAGVILGTAAYMAPEQARGKSVDTRADIWAFGVVLYELLTGKHLFEGEDLTETLASVLKETPNLGVIPERMRRLVSSCLQKDPKKRLQSIGDMHYLLEAPTEVRADVPPRSGWLWPAIAAIAALAMTVIGIIHFREKPPTDAVMRLSVSLPDRAGGLGHLVLSPDGLRVAATFGKDNWNGLWVRALDGTEWTPLDSAQNARAPFWSRDSRFLGFFAGNKLKVVSAAGGPAKELCTDTGLGRGGTWNRDDLILFASETGPLRKVQSTGGACTAVTKTDPIISKAAPEFLPDGKHYLYVGNVSGDTTKGGVYVASLDDPIDAGLGKKVLEDISSIVYTELPGSGGVGHLLFLRGTTLMAQHFDSGKIETKGDPFPVANQASRSLSGILIAAGAASNGTLVYIANLYSQYQLTWIDRSGKMRTKVDSPADQRSVSLSRDGNLATVNRTNEGMLLYDLARISQIRFSTEINPSAGVWSRDGSQIVYATTQNGVRGIYRKAANGSGKEELLLATPDNDRRPSDWSLDGKFLIFTELDPKTRADIWYLPDPGKPDSKPVQFLKTGAMESQGQLSPDGRWLAYVSDETGTGEVYIRQFPSGEGFHKVSMNNGREPRWNKNGSELDYLHFSERGLELMAVPLQSDGHGGLRPGTPTRLFDFQSVPLVHQLNAWIYSPHPDGQRFLVAVFAETATPSINVITNWRKATPAASSEH
jgi:serine/threonine protein kinase/Tol biopolymer transport system component